MRVFTHLFTTVGLALFCSQTLNAEALMSADFELGVRPRDKTRINISVGCLIGGAAGAIIDSQNKSESKNTTGTIAVSSLIGCGGGLGWDLLTNTEDNEKKISQELEKMKQMDRNEGRTPQLEAMFKGPQRIKCPNGSQKDEAMVFCTDSNGELSDCSEIGFSYLSSDLAISMVGFYSPQGCFPPPYTPEKNLQEYFKPILKQAREEISK